MKQRSFALEDQMAFAKLSGDYNPLHIDNVVARRLIFGRPVVHGVHSLLWALDTWVGSRPDPVEFRAVKSVFLKPIPVEEVVEYSLACDEEDHVEIELLVDGSVATTIAVAWAAPGDTAQDPPPGNPERRDCRVLSFEATAGASGSLGLYLDAGAAKELFPCLMQRLSPIQLAEILATTRLVGMECPGLHSVFSELNLTFHDEVDGSFELTYEVAKSDKRFSMLLMEVAAPGMKGRVKAFVRPGPQEQDSFLSLSERVDRTEFAGQRAVVIGGSRGLGEVASKLLSAGGAEVRITYHLGAEDARRVVDEILAGGGSASSLSLDVLDEGQDWPGKLGNGWVPTHMYYFATPFIASAAKGTFSTPLFLRFCDYYVTGFLRSFEQLKKLGLKNVFYPSSVFVDQVPSGMGEYAAAKMAGEVLCTFLEKHNRGIAIHKPRLPRMSTDQTASILPVNSQEPVPTMLKHLRHLRDSSHQTS